jgi:hypothetical protein
VSGSSWIGAADADAEGSALALALAVGTGPDLRGGVVAPHDPLQPAAMSRAAAIRVARVGVLAEVIDRPDRRLEIAHRSIP